MPNTDIIGYDVAVFVRKGEDGFYSLCPGVGGVYEEGNTEQKAYDKACKAAVEVLRVRHRIGADIVEDNDYLTVRRRPAVSPVLRPRVSHPDRVCHVDMPAYA